MFLKKLLEIIKGPVLLLILLGVIYGLYFSGEFIQIGSTIGASTIVLILIAIIGMLRSDDPKNFEE